MISVYKIYQLPNLTGLGMKVLLFEKCIYWWEPVVVWMVCRVKMNKLLCVMMWVCFWVPSEMTGSVSGYGWILVAVKREQACVTASSQCERCVLRKVREGYLCKLFYYPTLLVLSTVRSVNCVLIFERHVMWCHCTACLCSAALGLLSLTVGRL